MDEFTAEGLTDATREQLKGMYKPQIVALVADGKVSAEQAGLFLVERFVRSLLKERARAEKEGR